MCQVLSLGSMHAIDIHVSSMTKTMLGNICDRTKSVFGGCQVMTILCFQLDQQSIWGSQNCELRICGLCTKNAKRVLICYRSLHVICIQWLVRPLSVCDCAVREAVSAKFASCSQNDYCEPLPSISVSSVKWVNTMKSYIYFQIYMNS